MRAVDVQTLEISLSDRIAMEIGNILEIVVDKVYNVISPAMDNIMTSRVELAARSMNESSGRDAASVTANSKRGEQLGITALFGNAFDRNITFREFKITDETRSYNPDEVSEFPVPRTHFDRQSSSQGSYYEKSCCFSKLFHFLYFCSN